MSKFLAKAVCPDSFNTTYNFTHIIKIGFVSFFLIFSYAVSALEHDAPKADKYDKDKALAVSQAALNRQIGSYTFLDQDKKPVDITQYRGKPLVISLIFTSCHHICPTITNYLAEVVDIAREALGEESFNVVTIGFDTVEDTPERMRLFARERNIDFNHWDFLSTDETTIKAFTDDMGFIFFKSPRGFDHLSQTSVLDQEGRVYRQIYGVEYEPPFLVEPLKELIFGKRTNASLVDSLINNIRLFCTIYDPHTGRYEFDYSVIVRLAMGILVLGAIAIFIVRTWRQQNNNRTV